MKDCRSRPILILAQSYPHVKNVLYLIDLHFHNSLKIKLLVFGNKYLFHFFKEINNEHFDNQIEINFIPKYRPLFQNILFRYILVFEKYFLLRIFKNSCHEVSGYKIYFFSKSFTDYGYYFLKRLYKKNSITYVQDPGVDVYNISDRKPENFKSFLIITYLKLLLGKDYVYGDTGRVRFHRFFKISENFYNKIVNKEILEDKRNRLQADFNLSKYSIKDYEDLQAIYFDKDIVKDGLCDDAQYQSEIEEVFKIIAEFFPNDKIGRKYKPDRTTSYNRNRLNVGKVIPDYIPAELLYNENIKCYFGITSIALANIDIGNVISLIYLFSFNDIHQRDATIKNQEARKKGKIIYYPKTLSELRNQIKLLK